MKNLRCKHCNKIVYNVGDNAKSVICNECVQKKLFKQFGFPEVDKKIKSTKPRGWQFMGEFTDLNGDYYEKGKLIKEKTKKTPTLHRKDYEKKVESKSKSKKRITKKEKEALFQQAVILQKNILKKIDKLNSIEKKSKDNKLTLKNLKNDLKVINKQIKKWS